jgi:hypothetical protein
MNEKPQTPDHDFPPGFYPDAGVSRYWDGTAWTEKTQDLDGTQGAAHAAPSGPKDRRPWFKKKRVIIPAVLVALLFIAGIAGGKTKGETDGTSAVAKKASEETVPAKAAPAPDADKDGVADDKDAFPSDAAESRDNDGNGIGDVADAKAVRAAQQAEKVAAKAKAEAKKKRAAKAVKNKREKRIANAPVVSERDLALVFKDPDSHTGELFQVWGQVTQFDAATGADAFLASAAHRNTMSYGFFDGENALFQGSEEDLGDLVEDDVFTATVEVTGSLSYDTQIGGSTTVPQFKVLKIKRN